MEGPHSSRGSSTNYTFLGRRYENCEANKKGTKSSGKSLYVDTRAIIRCLDRHSISNTNGNATISSNYFNCAQTSEWHQFEETLAYASQSYRNAIISDEAFSRLKINPYNLELLFTTIRQYFEPRLVIVYRRYFSWFLSRYNELYKPLKRRAQYQRWPRTKKDYIKPFVNYYNKHAIPVISVSGADEDSKTFADRFVSDGNYQEAANAMDLHPVEYLLQQWSNPNIPQTPTKDNVIVVNMHRQHHDDDDLVVKFVRQALSPDLAQELYHHKKDEAAKGRKVPKRENPSLNLDFDMMAVQAKEMGLLGSLKKWNRRRVAWYAEKTFGINGNNFTNWELLPRLCLDGNQLEEFLNRSLYLEEKVFGSGSRHFPREWQKEQHVAEFEEAKRKFKFCNLDTQQLLKHESVKKMFSSII